MNNKLNKSNKKLIGVSKATFAKLMRSEVSFHGGNVQQFALIDKKITEDK